MNYSLPEKWYAVSTFAGKEERVISWLENVYKIHILITEILFPKRKLQIKKQGVFKTQILPFFPGYFFINCSISNINLFEIKQCSFFVRIVGNKSGPISVKDEEITTIKNMINDEGVMEFSRGLILDQRVKILNGPLYGFEGIIKKIDKRKKRAKIQLNILNREKLIDIGLNIIEQT